MKKIILAICVLALCGCGQQGAKKNAAPAAEDTTLAKVPFGDPFIMLDEGTYYAYGTNHSDGIEVYVSDDLMHWKHPEGIADGLALNKNDVWGDNSFWAPEVYKVNCKYYMYFTAQQHISVATSDSPLGPFTQEVQKPMIENEECIDNSLFIDSNGKPYIYFDRFNDGLNIWVAELEDNLTDIKPGTMTKCINVSAPWEDIWPRVNEGPFVLRHNGTYYMTYSANSYESPDYAIGVATAQSPAGPWTKSVSNPILRRPGDLVGVGHSAMFTDKDGNLRIVFHAHNSQEKIHPRNMYIGTVIFEQDGDTEAMTIAPEYITARLRP